MDLLDMLNDDSVQVEEEMPAAKEKISLDSELKENSEVQKKSSGDEVEWLVGLNGKFDDNKRSKKQTKPEMLAELHQTKIKEGVEPDRFVWAPNQWYQRDPNKKNTSHAHNYFPARIVDAAEALRLTHEFNPETPVPGAVVVEYISACKHGHGRFKGALPKYVSVAKEDCVPYNENIFKAKAGKAQQRQATLMEMGNIAYKGASKEKWHPDGVTNLANYLGDFHSAGKAMLFHETMMMKAQQYLDHAFDLGVTGEEEEEEEGDMEEIAQETEREDNESESSDDEALTSFIAAGSDPNQSSAEKRKKNSKVVLRAGDWISYINKVFGTVTHTRIVEIKPAVDSDGKACTRRLVVENGDVLRRDDDIRRMEMVKAGPERGACDKKNGSSYFLVKNFRLKVGLDKSLKTIHQAASAMSKDNKIDVTRKTSPSSSAKKRRKEPDFIDDDDDDDGEESEEVKGLPSPKSSSQTQSQHEGTESSSGSVSVVSRPSSQTPSGNGKKKRRLSGVDTGSGSYADSMDSSSEGEGGVDGKAAAAGTEKRSAIALCDSDDDSLL